MKRVVLIAAACLSLGVWADGWRFADGTLTYSKDGSDSWKMVPSVKGTTVTLTSLESTIPADGVIDFVGALEAYGLTGTGYSLVFAEGEGLSVFASALDVRLAGCPWLGRMDKAAGAPFAGVTNLVVGTLGTDLDFGSGTGNTQTVPLENAVFSTAANLASVEIYGGNLKLANACSGSGNLRTVLVQSSGTLNMGSCSFNCGTKRLMTSAKVIAGGDLNLGSRTFRTSLATGASVYVEAPTKASVVLDAFPLYETETKYWINLYWNAPAPKTVNTSTDAFVGNTIVNWFVYNTPDVVAAWPKMNKTSTVQSAANSSMWVRLPVDPTDCTGEGFWRVRGTDENPYRGSSSGWGGYGALYWFDMRTGDWSYADGVLTSAHGWKLRPSFSDTTVTLTSEACTPPADGVLDLSGALQSMGSAAPAPLADLSLVLTEGDGLTVFSQVKVFKAAHCPWLGKMGKGSGAPLTSLEAFSVGMPFRDLVFGDSTANTGTFDTRANSVFSGTSTLREGTIQGRNVSLNNACSGHKTLKRISVRATGTLDTGVCAFNSGGSNFNLENVSFVAGGNIKIGGRTLRASVASNAVVYVEAPASATVTLDEWAFFQSNEKSPFSLYWNAAAPRTVATTTKPMNNKTVATWYFYNTPELVATYPAMSETSSVQSASKSSLYLRLPVDSSDTTTEGFWRTGSNTDANLVRGGNETGYGPAYWHAPSAISPGNWTYAQGVLKFVDGGSVQWEIVPSVSKKTLTLTSKNGTAAANGVLDLAGAVEALNQGGVDVVPGTDWTLVFNDAGGAFAKVKDLSLSNCPWLGRMEKQAGAGFSALERISVGMPDVDLVFGNGAYNAQKVEPSYSVFPDSANLGEVTILGDRLELDDAFAGLPNISNVYVKATRLLNLGNCSFNDGEARKLKRVSFISGGNLNMGWRTTRNALASDAVIYVEAPATATVTLQEYSFYNGTGTSYPVSMYWNAPKPVIAQNYAAASIMLTWYVYNTPELAATWTGMDGTFQNLARDFYMKLPADFSDTTTEGGWVVGDPGNPGNAYNKGFYKAFWYAPTVGVNGWSVDLAGQTLSHTNAAGLRDWELVPTISGTALTLSPNGVGTEVLDLCGAIETLDSSLSGMVLSFDTGTGAFANVKELYITNATWLAKMVRQSGASFGALEKFVVDTDGNDLVFGDGTQNALNVARSYSVFSESTVLADATICGGNVKLGNACSGHTTLTQVCVRATGTLDMGYCSFNCGEKVYNIQNASVIAGGDLKMGTRTFRTSFAANASLYVEAPPTATVTLQNWTFYQSNLSCPVKMYWNAPAPKTDHAQVMNGSTDVHWYVYNTPEIVDAWPTMDGTTFQRMSDGATLMIRLPADCENQSEEGVWCNDGNQNNASLRRDSNDWGWGPAYWYNPLPTTEDWTYDAENGLVFVRNGVARWRFTPALEGAKLTLTSQAGSNVPMDGRLDLAGALEKFGGALAGCSIRFVEGDGAAVLSQVRELYLTNCTWLTHLDASDGAVFTALEKLVVGTEGQDLVFGSGAANSKDADATTSVFPGAAATLRDVVVFGGNVQLKNAFVGAGALTQAVVKATGTLDTGTCSFSLPNMTLKRAELRAGGNLTMGDRTFRTAFAKNGKLYVSAPTNAVVTLNAYPLHQRALSKPISVYWSAPPPTGTSQASWSYLDMTWYVDAAYAPCFPPMGGAAVTNQLNGGSIRLSLPANPKNTTTAGFWRCDNGTGAPANGDNDHGCGAAYWCNRWEVEGRPCRFLSIGNSFSQQMFSSSYKFAASAKLLGHPLDAVGLVKGGCSLLTHWNMRADKGTYTLYKDFTSKENPLAGLSGTDVCLTDVLAAVDWDVIVIQQVSTDSPNPETYEPYMGNLVALFRELAPNAELRFQQTWAYDRDCAINSSFKFGGDVAKRDAMYDNIRDTVAEVCERYGMGIIPTGYAIQLYRYGLPVRTAAQDFCSADHRHMSNGQGGNYLQMLTWCMAAFGEMPTKTQIAPPTTPTGFDADLAWICASNAVMSVDHRDYGQGTVDFSYDVTFKGLKGEDLMVQSVTNGAFALPPEGKAYGLRITGWTTEDGSVTNTPAQIQTTPVYDWRTWYPVGGVIPGTMILFQ
ncbi:MAG: DUF4886 domain-containing protein [bacterium]|nr:DUF4886 domain-containing protein [bacterium]